MVSLKTPSPVTVHTGRTEDGQGIVFRAAWKADDFGICEEFLKLHNLDSAEVSLGTQRSVEQSMGKDFLLRCHVLQWQTLAQVGPVHIVGTCVIGKIQL